MERNNTYVDEFVTDCETIAYLCLLGVRLSNVVVYTVGRLLFT